MRKQIVAGVWLALAASNLVAAPQDTGDDAAKATAARELARTALARDLKLDVAVIESLSVEPHTWPDSSLGCGKPGAMAAQVITPGYVVLLKTPQGNYRVHAADQYAVVCGLATQFGNINRPGGRSVGLPLKNINQQIEIARADLAKKIGAPAKEIQTLPFVLTEWPDSSMECVVVGEAVVKQTTQGYRLGFQYAGRIYTYHTDLKRVRACPAIEVE